VKGGIRGYRKWGDKRDLKQGVRGKEKMDK
jgi:hypothetical protein